MLRQLIQFPQNECFKLSKVYPLFKSIKNWIAIFRICCTNSQRTLICGHVAMSCRAAKTAAGIGDILAMCRNRLKWATFVPAWRCSIASLKSAIIRHHNYHSSLACFAKATRIIEKDCSVYLRPQNWHITIGNSWQTLIQLCCCYARCPKLLELNIMLFCAPILCLCIMWPFIHFSSKHNGLYNSVSYDAHEMHVLLSEISQKCNSKCRESDACYCDHSISAGGVTCMRCHKV